MSCVKMTGTAAMKKAMQDAVKLEAIKTIVKKNTGDLKEKAHTLAEPGTTYVKGYSEGNIRDSIQDDLQDGGLTGVVGTQMEYAPYVEFGTRYMAAEPVFKPAMQAVEQKFLSDIKKVMGK